MGWIDDLKTLPISAVIRRGSGRTRGGSLICPCCKKKGRPTVRFGRHSWKCNSGSCGEKGGAVELASWLVTGKEKPAKGDRAGWRAFREAWTGHVAAVFIPPAPVRPVTSRQPNITAVRTLWNDSRPVVDDREVATWLQSRGLDPREVARLDIARALPAQYWGPTWARYRGHDWSGSGFRLVMRVVGPLLAGGWGWSMRARNINARAEPGRKVATAACGTGSATGLVYACPTARRVFRRKAPARIIISEGGPDWITWATRQSGWGCVGIWNGGWTQAIADRLPADVEVVIRTHQDQDGRKYGDKVEASLPASAVVWRQCLGVFSGGIPDDNDLWMDRRLPDDPRAGCLRTA